MEKIAASVQVYVEALEVRDALIRRLRKKSPHQHKDFINGFLATIGRNMIPHPSNPFRKVHGGSLSDHSARWTSPLPIQRGLGHLLIGLFPDLVFSVRRRLYVEDANIAISGKITAEICRRSEVVFVLLLWDWLKMSPWLRTMIEGKTLASQCQGRLCCWPAWKDAVACLRQRPRLYRLYRQMAKNLVGFAFYRRER